MVPGGRPVIAELKPLSRLGGQEWGEPPTVFELARPRSPDEITARQKVARCPAIRSSDVPGSLLHEPGGDGSAQFPAPFEVRLVRLVRRDDVVGGLRPTQAGRDRRDSALGPLGSLVGV